MILQERSTLKTLFDGPTKRKLFPDRSREQIFTGLSDWYARKHCRTGLSGSTVQHISICLLYITSAQLHIFCFITIILMTRVWSHQHHTFSALHTTHWPRGYILTVKTVDIIIHVNLPAGAFFSRFWGSLPSLPSTFKIFRLWKKSSTKNLDLHFAINISENSPFGTPVLTKNAERYEW